MTLISAEVILGEINQILEELERQDPDSASPQASIKYDKRIDEISEYVSKTQITFDMDWLPVRVALCNCKLVMSGIFTSSPETVNSVVEASLKEVQQTLTFQKAAQPVPDAITQAIKCATVDLVSLKLKFVFWSTPGALALIITEFPGESRPSPDRLVDHMIACLRVSLPANDSTLYSKYDALFLVCFEQTIPPPPPTNPKEKQPPFETPFSSPPLKLVTALAAAALRLPHRSRELNLCFAVFAKLREAQPPLLTEIDVVTSLDKPEQLVLAHGLDCVLTATKLVGMPSAGQRKVVSICIAEEQPEIVADCQWLPFVLAPSGKVVFVVYRTAVMEDELQAGITDVQLTSATSSVRCTFAEPFWLYGRKMEMLEAFSKATSFQSSLEFSDVLWSLCERQVGAAFTAACGDLIKTLIDELLWVYVLPHLNDGIPLGGAVECVRLGRLLSLALSLSQTDHRRDGSLVALCVLTARHELIRCGCRRLLTSLARAALTVVDGTKQRELQARLVRTLAEVEQADA